METASGTRFDIRSRPGGHLHGDDPPAQDDCEAHGPWPGRKHRHQVADLWPISKGPSFGTGRGAASTYGTEHKRANLLQHCPAHARRELRRDYNRIVYAKNGIDARKAYDELVAKWTSLAPAVVRSLEEAGNQLLTFYEFPRAMWKSIRTTNALENLNREFRRRTKTQASFSSEESAVALLFGLIASGQIQLRRIDGYQRLSEVLEHAEVAA